MTVSNSDAEIVYNGDGSTVAFPIPFAYFDKDHITATFRDAAGNTATWVRGTQYTLSGDGTESQGQLDVSTSPTDYTPGSGSTLTIELNVPNNQDKALPLGGRFPSTQVEEGLDLAAQRDQALARDITNAIRVLPGDKQAGAMALALDTLRANKYLGFGANGELAYLSGTTGPVDVGESLVTPTGASTSNTVADLFGLGALPYENIKLYGAKGDFTQGSDGTTIEASQVFSSTGTTFVDADVGKLIWVEGSSTTGKTITNIENGPIDAAYQWDADGVPTAAYVDVTEDFNDSGAGDVEPFPTTEAVGDRFYIAHIQEFDEVSITISTSGVGGVVQWKYWDGDSWENLSVTDNTISFTATPGTYTVTFTPPVDWATNQLNRNVNGRSLYYIAAEVTTVYTTNPVLSQGVLDGGRMRVTAANHLVEPYQWISIKDVVGTTEANGFWQAERINNDLFDIIGPSFSNSYTSGGTVHGRLETTIQSVSGGDATLVDSAGTAISGTAGFGFGTDDTAAVQAAVDTGKTVIIPPGNFFCEQITIQTDYQKFLGFGGQLVALPQTLSNSDGTRYPMIKVEANFVEVAGINMDNPSLGNEKVGSQWPDGINAGIGVEGFQCKIHHNVIRRFRDGIFVNFSSGAFTGPEYGHNIVANNICWELLGSGSGDNTRISNQGESDGDGIVSWGAATIITGNIVNPRVGADCRIGLHVEGLSDRYDPDDPVAIYIDSGAVITNNIVLAHDLDVKNGRFRRGITTEQVRDCTISNNVVYGGGWAAIEASVTRDVDDDEGPTGNVSIVGNSIRWTRPYVDFAGQDWSPIEACITVRSNTNDSTRGSVNVSITGNSVENKGFLSFLCLVRVFQIGGDIRNITISGNSFLNRTGRCDQSFNSTTDINELNISGNSFRQHGGGDVVRIQDTSESVIVSNNNVHAIDNTGHGIRASNTNSFVVNGNIIDGVALDAIQCINGDNAVVVGNIIKNIGDDGIDGFGTTNKILLGNVFTNIADAYTANWTPGATVIDADNVKTT